jgi:hypothetical protein
MENSIENKTLELESGTLKNLNTTRKWTMFFAVLGFIMIGIMLIAGLFAVLFLSVFKGGNTGIGLPEGFIFIFIVLFAIIYFFPVLYLFRFSKHMGNAVKDFDKTELNKAFRNLKSYYVLIGILTILFMALYVVAIIIAGSSVALLKTF